MSETCTDSPRVGKALHDATRPFAEESVARGWWHVCSTLSLLAGVLVAAALLPWWPARTAAALFGSLLMIRSFILYHDYMHGAILKRSKIGRAIMYAYSMFALTPPKSWRHSHNYHHANVGKIDESGVGSFPQMTAQMWREASKSERLFYRLGHHPVIILLGYPIIFAFNVCLLPLIRHPAQHWDSAVSLVVHGGTITLLWIFLGFDAAFFAFILPTTVACALGGYLFYAQHNFEGMRIMAPEKWNYYDAAMLSSSYLKVGPIMQYFTGNIGFHHIHHLNSKIPFYRLPEVMAEIPELQHPVVTTLHPRDIINCFRLTLWDPDRDGMVTYRQAMETA